MDNNMENYEATMDAARKFFEIEDFNFYGENPNGDGFVFQVYMEERTYNVNIRVDRSTNKVIMEMFPGIHVAKAYRNMVSGYIAQINTQYKDGNFRITDNGTLYNTNVTSFADGPINPYTFRVAFCLLLEQNNVFAEAIDSLAHGVLVEPQCFDVCGMIARSNAKPTEQSPFDFEGDEGIEDFFADLGNNDDDDGTME